jgi:hypothetical protein
VEHCHQASLLIIGEPGSGKSGALYAAAKQISADGQPVLAIAVDRHPVSTLDELRRELRLERPIIEVLRDWNGDRKGVLFVDALDATRGGPSERVFQDLIRRVLQEAPNWHVIASIRVFDLRFGVVYRDLFEGVPPDGAYRDTEFSRVRHISIPRLTEDELQQVWAASAPMERAYDDGSPVLRDLLRSPFNLFLLANVLSSETPDLRGVTTQLQLLQRYWSYRVIGSDRRGMSREGVLRLAVDQMLELARLQISLADLPGASAEDVDRLLSEGVLAPVDPSRDRLSRISFAHHVLFDYAVARLALEEGRAKDFVQRLTDSDQRALLVAPAATIALEALWRDDDSGRPVFWRTAMSMAGAAGAGSFCRMLPARVATNLAADVRDFAPVLDCLRQPDCTDRSCAVFLVRHATGALSAGVKHQATPEAPLGPWPAISHAFAESAIGDVGWMLKPLVAQWVEDSAALSASDAEHIGATARLMLDFGSGAPYDSSMVVVGIQGTARTFGFAPEQSAMALRQLLSHEHVAAHGHEELSWVARELPHLYPHSGDTGTLLGDVYRAAYCAALPSADEKTSLGGSRILSLTSNRRQDFEHALWELFEQFPRFFEVAPEDATIALIDVVACSPEAQRRVGDERAVPFDFGGRAARYLPDNSSAWARRHDDHKAPPVRAFETGLMKLADDGRTEELRHVINVVVDRSQAAGVWAALLRAGAAKPREIGFGLQPLIKTVAVLEGRDTRKPAGDLIASLHPLLSERDRIAVEAAILATDEYTQPILLGCLPEAQIASQEVRDRLKALREQRPLPPNREPFEVTTSWRGGDDDWWLREEGVDLSVVENAALNDAIKAASGLRKAREAGEATVSGRWPAVESLFRTLQTRGDIPEALRMSAWQAIAEAVGVAAEGASTSADLERFPEIEQMVSAALNPLLWPLAEADPEREAAFAKMPSWSSPAPRVEAAGALMALVRAKGRASPDDERLVRELARDPRPEVRHQILARTNLLFDASPALMSELYSLGFDEERNEGVLSFFLPAVGPVIRSRPDWFTVKLLELDDRFARDPVPEDRRDEFLGQMVQLLLRSWMVYDQDAAGARVREWTADPVVHAKRVQDALRALRGAIIQGDPQKADPADDRVRIRAIEVFERTVAQAAPLLARSAEIWDSLSPPDRASGETALAVLDTAATEIYFGSGAYGQSKGTDSDGAAPSSGVRQRFLREMGPTLAALATAPYPSVTHHLLETLEQFTADEPALIFRLVTDALSSGGRRGGYQFESLGAELFVRIVRRYLADFRSVLVEDEGLRHRLISALDAFVDAGWPQARRLVYDLPEMLR